MAESATRTLPTARDRVAAISREDVATRNSIAHVSRRSGLRPCRWRPLIRRSDSRDRPTPRERLADRLRSPFVVRLIPGIDPVAGGACSRAFRPSGLLEPRVLHATARRDRASPSTSDAMTKVAFVISTVEQKKSQSRWDYDSISSRVGIDGCAPRRVTEIDAATLAK